jgi:hydrogenase maturation protein HypF
VWGGEVLVGDLSGFTRVAHLRPVRLPGGDRAVRQPWRMACAWLVAARDAEPAPLPGIEARTWHAVAQLARTGLAAPLTTSMGRLFDAVAALCGLRAEVTFEGQAAVELEAIADRTERGAYPLDVAAGVLDARPTVLAVADDVAAGVQPAVVGARFHRAVARAPAQACAEIAGARGLDTVVLAGGVWQNRLLLELTVARLREGGLRVLVPERLPPNDGAISFGQAAVAAALSARTR